MAMYRGGPCRDIYLPDLIAAIYLQTPKQIRMYILCMAQLAEVLLRINSYGAATVRFI